MSKRPSLFRGHLDGFFFGAPSRLFTCRHIMGRDLPALLLGRHPCLDTASTGSQGVHRAWALPLSLTLYCFMFMKRAEAETSRISKGVAKSNPCQRTFSAVADLWSSPPLPSPPPPPFLSLSSPVRLYALGCRRMQAHMRVGPRGSPYLSFCRHTMPAEARIEMHALTQPAAYKHATTPSIRALRVPPPFVQAPQPPNP